MSMTKLERRTLEFYAKYRDVDPSFSDVVRFNAYAFLYWLVTPAIAFAVIYPFLGLTWALPAVTALLGAGLRELRRAYTTVQFWPWSRSLLNWDEVDRRLASLPGAAPNQRA